MNIELWGICCNHVTMLTRWGRVTHIIYASINQDTNGSDNGLSPTQSQVIFYLNQWRLLINHTNETHFNEIIEINQIFIDEIALNSFGSSDAYMCQ